MNSFPNANNIWLKVPYCTGRLKTQYPGYVVLVLQFANVRRVEAKPQPVNNNNGDPLMVLVNGTRSKRKNASFPAKVFSGIGSQMAHVISGELKAVHFVSSVILRKETTGNKDSFDSGLG